MTAISSAGTTTTGRISKAVYNLQADRLIGIVGAVTVLVATGLSWYSRELSISVGGVAEHTTTGFTLWDVRNTAAWGIVACAAIGAFALVLPSERRGGMVAAVAGFAVSVYGAVALFDLPNLGNAALIGSSAAATVGTSVGVGPFVAILGGLLLFTGGVAAAADAVADDLSEARG